MTNATTSLPAPTTLSVTRSAYLAVLGSLFSLFNTARVLAYLPTIWALALSGDASVANALMCLAIVGAIAWTRL